mmetsp:Transcript_12175/g.28913  ORF Transcript_12175/g.28913 Transcript_12175/m.28913 type:complete len:156 (-) Transcript_12175:121-588(-)
MTTNVTCVRIIIVFGAVLACLMLVAIGNEEERKQEHVTKETTKLNFLTPKLNMTLCTDKCNDDNCIFYITPINECFSSTVLFPNDHSWSGKDVRDNIITQTQTLVRTIFDTKNGTCNGGGNDIFHIPLNECVGPFGRPRPWGIFHMIQVQAEKLR